MSIFWKYIKVSRTLFILYFDRNDTLFLREMILYFEKNHTLFLNLHVATLVLQDILTNNL